MTAHASRLFVEGFRRPGRRLHPRASLVNRIGQGGRGDKGGRSSQENGQHGTRDLIRGESSGWPVDRAARPARLQRHNSQCTKREKASTGADDRAKTAASDAGQGYSEETGCAPCFFPGNGGYMALAVLIAVMADGLAWTLNIGVAVLAGAAAGIVQFALSRNLRMAKRRAGRMLNPAHRRVRERMKQEKVPRPWRKARPKPRRREGRRRSRRILDARPARISRSWRAHTRSSTAARRDSAWIAMNSSSGARTGVGA